MGWQNIENLFEPHHPKSRAKIAEADKLISKEGNESFQVTISHSLKLYPRSIHLAVCAEGSNADPMSVDAFCAGP